MPFLRITVALATGILLGSVLLSGFMIPVSILALLFGGLHWLNHRYHFSLVVLYGVYIHLVFVLAGMAVYSHYNRKPSFFSQGKFCATVSGIILEKPNSYQTILNVEAVINHDSVFNADEKVMAYFEKSSSVIKLEPGDKIMFNRFPRNLKHDNNPYAFDYKHYLARKKIYRQVYLPDGEWMKCDFPSSFSLPVYAEKVRMKMLEVYDRQISDEQAVHVLSALTLGYKSGLEPGTRQTFASSGAMHVLAVSGLHTGIVFLMMSFFFGSLRRQETGRWVYIFMVIALLWCFAFVTGLSPSVKRAATMFCFVTVGNGIRRRSNIYNTLAASAFFLLLFNPNNLFDVGFQLSYAAVFGIVFLKPRLDRILILRNRIIRYGWDLISVSISAQIATFPLTVCYFHQIPVYSCLANLLVIPLVTLLIPLGLGLLLFNWIPTFTAICGHAVDFILPCMIRFLEWIEDLPFSSIGFYFSNLEMVFVCSIFFFAFLFIESTNKRFFKAILFLCLFLAVTSLAEKTERLFRREIIVYNCSGSTIIHLISGRNNYVIAGDSTWEDGIVRKIVDETVGRLQLDEPFFLESNAFYRDSLLFLKEGIIFFEGKMISLGKHPDLTFFKPQFLIGSFSDIDAKRMKFTDQKMISTLRVTKDFSNDRSEVFFLQAEGAYREKW